MSGKAGMHNPAWAEQHNARYRQFLAQQDKIRAEHRDSPPPPKPDDKGKK